MTSTLLILSFVLILCIMLTKVSNKMGMPMLLAFIILGMLFGSDGIFKIPFDNSIIMEQIATIALIFIIFYGGFGTKWTTAKPVVVKAVVLSTLGVILTALFVGLFCYYILKLPILISFLIGSVISSTDAASVFSILRSKKLNLKDGTAPLLEFESGSNDPASYMLTIIMLTLITGDFSTGSFLYMLFTQIVFGLLAGALIAYGAVKILKYYNFSSDGMRMIFFVAVAILSYALPTFIGGNGLLSAYIVGIVLGNTKLEDKKPLVYFFDGVTDLMQMGLFFLLGLLSFPSHFSDYIYVAIAIAVFLTFIARPLASFILMTPFKAPLNQQLLVSFAGLRGAASIVFAIMAQNGLKNSDFSNYADAIFNIVFIIVLFSILLQGSLLPWASKKLKMIDDSEDVMKTFTDYSDESPVKFIKSVLSNQHPWIDKPVKEITLPPDTIIALLQRKNEKIVPKGNTILRENDILIMCAKAGDNVEGVKISEKQIDNTSQLMGKKVAEIKAEENMLIVMIQRNNNVIIPRGNTVIENGDVLIINHT